MPLRCFQVNEILMQVTKLDLTEIRIHPIVVRRLTKTTVNQRHLTKYFKFKRHKAKSKNVECDTMLKPEKLQTTFNQIKNFDMRHNQKRNPRLNLKTVLCLCVCVRFNA